MTALVDDDYGDDD